MKAHILAFTILGIATLANQLHAKGKANRPDPEQIVSRMIADFDEDENNELSSEELLDALAFRQEQRMARIDERRDRNCRCEDRRSADRPRGDRFAKGRGERGTRLDPADTSTKLIKQFDASGDGSLDGDELTEALTFLQQNRPRRGPIPADQAGAATEDA